MSKPDPADCEPRPEEPCGDANSLPELAAREEACGATLDRVGDLQKQICALQAEQLRQLAVFVDQRNGLDADIGVPMCQAQYRCLVAEVAIACNLSNLTAQTLLSDAYALVTWHPFTVSALQSGAINLPAARAVARETRLLDDPAHQALADRVIAEELPDVSPGKIRGLVERRVIEIDPDAAARKAITERADKHVVCTPGDPGTAFLNAYLPAEQAVACWHALDDHARALHAGGDARSISHLMCDTLVERVTGVTTPEDIRVHLNLVMTDSSLLAVDEQPAELVRCGPIPAPIARFIAASGTTWVKRLYTDPVDATLVAADSSRRRFDGALRDFILRRDGYCRGIKCSSPIRDIDHIQPHSVCGVTTVGNGQGLSKNCHTSRDHPGMRLGRDAETGVVTWTTPTRRIYRSLPPPALGDGASTPTQLRHRRWMLHPPPSTVEQQFTKMLLRHKRRPRAG